MQDWRRIRKRWFVGFFFSAPARPSRFESLRANPRGPPRSASSTPAGEREPSRTDSFTQTAAFQHTKQMSIQASHRLAANIRLPLDTVATTRLAPRWARPITARLSRRWGQSPSGQWGASAGTAPVLPGGRRRVSMNLNVGLSSATLPFHRAKRSAY